MIVTERLLLRRPSRADFDAVHRTRSDLEIMRFLGGKPLSREEAWNRLTRNAGHWQLLGYGLFAVVEKESGCFVGEAGLMQAHRGLGERFDPFPEAGWIVAREAQGRGYATEAMLAAQDWFARSVGAARTVCIIAPENGASLRVAAKLGYTAFGSACYHDSTVTMLERRAS